VRARLAGVFFGVVGEASCRNIYLKCVIKKGMCS
jgi:hypothetical protein